MTKKSNSISPPSPTDLDLEIYQAMRLKGWLIPQTADEVLETERKDSSQNLPLPSKLHDPMNAFRKARKPVKFVRSSQATVDQDTAENLARAARNGAQLAPEVEQKMLQDRLKAEGKDQ